MKRLATALLSLTLLLGAASVACAEGPAKININTATVEELAKVPGLNDKLAAAIAEYRESIGDLKSLDELSQIEGMTPEVVKKAKEGLSVDAVASADCNC